MATCLPFWKVRNLDYTFWDDDINVYANAHFLEGPLENVGVFWTKGYEHLWIPLTYTVWAALAEVAELPEGEVHHDSANLLETPFSPRIFHLANLGVHFCAVLLVLGILRSLLGDRARWAPVFGAAVFAAHPLQVEPVAWITGMKDLLAGTLSLAAIWASLRSLPKPEPGRPSEGPCDRRWYGVATLFFITALLAKPATVVVPGIVFVFEVLLRGRPWKAALVRAIPWLVLALAATAVTWFAQSGGKFHFIAPPWWERPIIALDAVYFYLSKALFPAGLATEYGRSPAWLEDHWVFYVTWLIPLLALAAAWRWWRQRGMPVYLAGLAVFVLALLPVLGLIPFAYQGVSTVADRYAYLAMLGFVLALAALVSPLTGRTRQLAAAILVAVLAILSARQVRFWQDSDTLFTRAMEINPNSWLSLYNLGVIANIRDQRDDAMAYFKRAVELRPSYSDAHNNLGAEYALRGDSTQAAYHFRMALAADPGHKIALENFVSDLAKNGEYEEAIRVAFECYEKLPYVRTARTLASALFQHAAYYFNRQEYSSAMEQLEKALNFHDFEEGREALGKAYNNVGVTHVQKGERDEGIEYFFKAIDIYPATPDAPKNLAITLRNAGRAAEAVDLFTKFQSRYADDPDFLFSFAVALENVGRNGEAAAMGRRALELLDAETAPNAASRQEILDWLRKNSSEPPLEKSGEQP